MKKVLLTMLVACALALPGAPTFAAPASTVEPPLLTIYAPQISNEEVFYVGGASTAPNATVVVYLQSEAGAVITKEVQTDAKGAWFYTHHEFLKRGTYKVWTQLKVDDILSPPSPEVSVTVIPTAFQLGSTRLSYEQVYGFVSLLLLLAIVLMAFVNFRHWQKLTEKKRRLAKEIAEAEAAVRRGFEILHKDISASLETVKRAKLSRELAHNEREREEKLLKDLGLVESFITREVEDIEREMK